MPRVVCSLPNAGHLINGVRFASLGDAAHMGMLSEEIPEEVAGEFCAIPGYTLYAKPIDTQPHPPRNAHRAALKETT